MNAHPDWRLSEPGAAPVSAQRNNAPNVTGVERWATIGAGVALTAYALRKRGATGLLLGLASAALIGRGMSGRDPLRHALTPTDTERDIAAKWGWSHAALTGHAVTIGKPKGEVYAFFRDFSNLPPVMQNIERIDLRDDNHSHWVVNGPFGKTVEFDSVLTNDQADTHFAWHSVGDDSFENAGTVDFRDAPGGRGTEVHVLVAFNPPAGMLGRTVGGLMMKDPAIMLREDLKRVKMKLETGEVATSAAPDASPRGSGPPKPSPF